MNEADCLDHQHRRTSATTERHNTCRSAYRASGLVQWPGTARGERQLPGWLRWIVRRQRVADLGPSRWNLSAHAGLPGLDDAEQVLFELVECLSLLDQVVMALIVLLLHAGRSSV